MMALSENLKDRSVPHNNITAYLCNYKAFCPVEIRTRQGGKSVIDRKPLCWPKFNQSYHRTCSSVPRMTELPKLQQVPLHCCLLACLRSDLCCIDLDVHRLTNEVRSNLLQTAWQLKSSCIYAAASIFPILKKIVIKNHQYNNNIECLPCRCFLWSVV